MYLLGVNYHDCNGKIINYPVMWTYEKSTFDKYYNCLYELLVECRTDYLEEPKEEHKELHDYYLAAIVDTILEINDELDSIPEELFGPINMLLGEIMSNKLTEIMITPESFLSMHEYI